LCPVIATYFNDAGSIICVEFGSFMFGSIEIDGKMYKKDVVIDRGEVRKREKKVSKKYKEGCGHTPLSVDESLPFDCKILVIGTGYDGAMPVMDGVKNEARKKGVDLRIMKTADAINEIKNINGANAVLHLTC